jgi:hypothetical protein
MKTVRPVIASNGPLLPNEFRRRKEEKEGKRIAYYGNNVNTEHTYKTSSLQLGSLTS